jgi:hypothetical protein
MKKPIDYFPLLHMLKIIANENAVMLLKRKPATFVLYAAGHHNDLDG